MRRLRLNTERLYELPGDELAGVAGGTHLGCRLTDQCGHGPSFDAQCPTTPLFVCLSLDGSYTCNCIQTS